MWSFNIYFVARLNKLLNEHSSRRWIETLMRSNAVTAMMRVKMIADYWSRILRFSKINFIYSRVQSLVVNSAYVMFISTMYYV